MPERVSAWASVYLSKRRILKGSAVLLNAGGQEGRRLEVRGGAEGGREGRPLGEGRKGGGGEICWLKQGRTQGALSMASQIEDNEAERQASGQWNWRSKRALWKGKNSWEQCVDAHQLPDRADRHANNTLAPDMTTA